jgi:hypothetical protein
MNRRRAGVLALVAGLGGLAASPAIPPASAAAHTAARTPDPFAVFYRQDATGAAARTLAARNCGTERWPVKTGTDADRNRVSTHPRTVSITYLRRRHEPSTRPQSSRVAPVELRTYRVHARLVKYAHEADGDYHLVLQGSHHRTIVAEIPSPSCVGRISPFKAGTRRARRHFDARYTATSSFKTTHSSVTIKGVGFFDFYHGQTGMAPNNLELHPVTGLAFH